MINKNFDEVDSHKQPGAEKYTNSRVSKIVKVLLILLYQSYYNNYQCFIIPNYLETRKLQQLLCRYQEGFKPRCCGSKPHNHLSCPSQVTNHSTISNIEYFMFILPYTDILHQKHGLAPNISIKFCYTSLHTDDSIFVLPVYHIANIDSSQ